MKVKMQFNQKGMTLVEVMVALTIYTMVIVTIIAVMVSMANIKTKVIMNDKETATQKSDIEAQTNIIDSDGSNKVQYGIYGDLGTAIANDSANFNNYYAFNYQSKGSSMFGSKVDWRLKYFTNVNNSIIGDFTSNPTNKLYKICLTNTTDSEVVIKLTYDKNKTEIRKYNTQFDYEDMPDTFKIPAGATQAFGAYIKDPTDSIVIAKNGETGSYTLFSTTMTTDIDLSYTSSSGVNLNEVSK